LWQLRKFKTKDYKYKTPHGIFGENSKVTQAQQLLQTAVVRSVFYFSLKVFKH
jgi:hypothetical protein